MEGGMFTGIGNGTQLDTKVVQTFQKSFVQVQDILDQNRLLINEINQNHESKIPDNLSRNVGLIRELNNNIRRVVDLYADLSGSFSMSMEASEEAESSGTLKSDGKSSEKRIRSGMRIGRKESAERTAPNLSPLSKGENLTNNEDAKVLMFQINLAIPRKTSTTHGDKDDFGHP